MQKRIKDKANVERLKPLISLPGILMMFCHLIGVKQYTVDYSKAFLLFDEKNRKRKSHDFCTKIGQWSDDRRR
jgi:hypothetical protein